MSFDTNLRTVARTMPDKPLPATLESRVQSALPDITETDRATKPQRYTRRLVITALVATVLGVATLIAPRLLTRPGDAAEMRRAIGNAQTWHFVGFRLQDGKPVRWEIWGRRSPFMYREQFGNELLLDDGRRRIHVLPPDPADGRPKGTYMITPSHPLQPADGSTSDETHGAGFLAGVGGEDHTFDELSPVPGDRNALRGETVVDFGSMPPMRERTVLDVDAQSYLPLHYRVTQEEFAQPKDGTADVSQNAVPIQRKVVAELSPLYNVDLPSEIAAAPSTAGYAVADATIKPTGISGITCDRQGLTLQAERVGQDAAGNIRLRFQGWLGGKPIRQNIQGLMLIIRLDGLTATDETGTPYVWISDPPWTGTDSEHPELWLTRTTELASGSSPRTLTLALPMQLSRFERMGNSGRTVAVLGDTFAFTIPLPAEKQSLGWDTAPSSPQIIFEGVRPTLKMETAEKRGFYFSSNASSTTGRDESAYLKQAERCYEVMRLEADHTHNHMMSDLARKNLESVEQRLGKIHR